MSERHTSPALRQFPATLMHTAPLNGVEARMYDRLWRAMVEGKLKPGTKLREDVIGETFGVSRTLVRKVLLVMEQEGIVYLPVNHGAYVATPSPDDARAVHEAAIVTLSHIVRRLAAPGNELSAEHRSLIDQHLRAQREAEEDGDFVTARLLTGDFFVLLAAIHGNTIMAHLVNKMILRYGLALNLYQAGAISLDLGKFQTEVIEAIENHEPERAAVLIEKYFFAVERSLRFDSSGDDVDLKSILSTTLEAKTEAAI